MENDHKTGAIRKVFYKTDGGEAVFLGSYPLVMDTDPSPFDPLYISDGRREFPVKVGRDGYCMLVKPEHADIIARHW